MRALKALYVLVLRHQLTRNRIIVVAVLTAFSVLIGVTVIRNNQDPDQLGAELVTRFGLSFIIPVVCLLLASAALGEWVEDETMVYVWLRPVRRWVIAIAAYLAVITVALPINLIPMLSMVVGGGATDRDLYVGVLLSNALATVGYSALFLLLGLLAKKALPFGLLYIFVWESVLVGLFPSAGRLSVGSYAATAMSRITGRSLEDAGLNADFFNRAEWATWVIPLAIAVVSVGLTTWRLERMDVA